MKMKRIASLALALAMALTLASCGGKSTGNGGNSSAASGASDGSASTGGSTYPNQTITLICPYGAGGGTDVLLRSLSDAASKIAGVNIVVENITGGNGATGVVTMMDAEPDGYTIGSCSGEWVALKEMGLAPDGFDYNNAEKIMHYNFDPACYLVPVDSPYQTLEDLINDAKANPGKITLGVTAAGGSHHLASLLFQKESGTEFNVIPYSDGSAAAVTALISGQVDVGSVCPAEAAAQIQAGQVRILGICSENRLANYPDVPTLKELGYDVVYGAWRGLCAPKGTPDEVVEKLEEIFCQAAETQEFKDFCANNGNELDLLTKEEFEERFVSQEALIKDVCAIYTQQQNG